MYIYVVQSYKSTPSKVSKIYNFFLGKNTYFEDFSADLRNIWTIEVEKAVFPIPQTRPYLRKDGRKTGTFLTKNTGIRRAKGRAKFKFLDERSFGGNLYSTFI